MEGEVHESSILHANRTLDFLKQGIENANDVSLWFSVAKLLDEHVIREISLLMPDSEKIRFRKSGYKRLFDRLWAPIPIDNGRKLLGWLENAHVHLTHGLRSELVGNPSGKIEFDRLYLMPSPVNVSARDMTNEFDAVILTTGIAANLSKFDNPLVHKMHGQRLIEEHPAGGIKIEPDTGRIVSAEVQNSGLALYSLTGSLMVGTDHFTNSYYAVCASAARTAQAVAKQIHSFR
jgi:hypothetical protein